VYKNVKTYPGLLVTYQLWNFSRSAFYN
jgi:hypothetical protein